MTIVNTYAAESWDKIYSAFQQINFTSYDYDTVKESLLQYMQIYHAEDYNDFIESSELTALLELFAYTAELLAYRTDAAAHENFITTAQRKQSILRLAKLISYSATRNIPARGLVKINTVRTDERIFDSLGNNLAGQTITWNDPNNANWKEQFFLVMNLVLTTRFGQPSKSFQISDVLMQLYTFNNTPTAFRNGVHAFTAIGTSSSVPMEVVPMDIDANGPLERSPDMNAQFNIAYASDGRGDGSDYTGFLMFVKQGSLVLTTYEITEAIANRRLTLSQNNVNDTDVWVYRVDDIGSIVQRWSSVPSLIDQTLAFNTINSRYKYEVETLENDKIALVFGDGNFSEIPLGKFQLWTRSSVNQNITIPKNRIVGQGMAFTYVSDQNANQTCTLTFSLTSALQNNSASETTEHVRQAAPSTYYAQNRMVNAQDHNTLMLRDSTILKLNSINRTFAGQPKYIDWNDASGAYQNIKLFGDDLTLSLRTGLDSRSTSIASKALIDTYLEPLLSTNSVLNTLIHQMASTVDYIDDTLALDDREVHSSGYGIISLPRRKFIEDNRKMYKTIDGTPVTPYGYQLGELGDPPTPFLAGDGSLLEKTAIQAALDGHWYGEPVSTAVINGAVHGVIPDPILNPESTGKLYITDLPRTIDGANAYPPGDTGSGMQPVQRQKYFGLKFNRFLAAFGDGQLIFNTTTLGDPQPVTSVGVNGLPWIANQVDRGLPSRAETITVEMTSDGTTFSVISNLRGRLPNYSTVLAEATDNRLWSEQVIDASLPFDFSIEPPSISVFEPGDAFIVDISYKNPNVNATGWGAALRKFGDPDAQNPDGTPRAQVTMVNLTGWWELIPSEVVTRPVSEGGLNLFKNGYADGPDSVQRLIFDQSNSGSSWVFMIARKDDDAGNVAEWSIYNRDMKVIASSKTTKFWYNQDSQLIDAETLKPLYDKIRILRSNLDEYGMPLRHADIYDCVGFVYNDDGEIEYNSIEVMPSDTTNFTRSGDGIADNILQFENFARGSNKYVLYNVSDPENPSRVRDLMCSEYIQSTGYDTAPYDMGGYDKLHVDISGFSAGFTFTPGNFLSDKPVDGHRLAREIIVPSPAAVNSLTGEYGCNATKGLDFMWQHYTPDSNLIDPSVSNIHDTYILTSGHYNNVMSYVRGVSSIPPTPPTPLELRTSYGYLLENKMLSDTIVLHPGKLKLLFGAHADQKLRARFSVVLSPTATFSAERIKQEVVSVINRYFEISNWDFGDTFYATELLSMIHQALPTQISSVVIVPTYSVNSFGSLFTIKSGIDEILQSCATISDVEIVSALTPSVLRQNM